MSKKTVYKKHYHIAGAICAGHVSIEPNGKNPHEVSKAITSANKAAGAKELDLRNTNGPHSIPDRHYPQVVKALPWPPKEEE